MRDGGACAALFADGEQAGLKFTSLVPADHDGR